MAHRGLSDFRANCSGAAIDWYCRMVLSNELISEVVSVLRYPKLQEMYRFNEADLLEYAQFLRSVSHVATLKPGCRTHSECR